jgi:O-antigen chain-terminating methyltransferase
VQEGDALDYLRSLPDACLGGLIATQVVEHLQPDYLLAFLDQAQRVLRPGSPIVLETINVACWTAFFESYIRDITHVRPLHPDTLQFLVRASGFGDVEVRFSAPVDERNKLKTAPTAPRPTERGTDDEGLSKAVARLTEVANDNVARLNGLLFTNLDYAVIAQRK